MNAQVDRRTGQSPTAEVADSAGSAGRVSSGAELAACDAPIIGGPTVRWVNDLKPMGEAADAARCLVRRKARGAPATRGPVAMRRRPPCRHAAVRPHPKDQRKVCADGAALRLATASRERAADAR
jgi:hypothetical protein